MDPQPMTDPDLIRKLLHSLGRLTQSELDSGLAAADRMAQYRPDLITAQRVLRSIEFCRSPDGDDRCPSCNGREPNHRPNCQLFLAKGQHE